MLVSKTIKTFTRLVALAAFSIAAVVSGVGLPAGTALASSGSASLTLNPSSGHAAPNTNFTVSLMVDSGTSSTNAIQADLDYPSANFAYVGVDDSGSAFGLAGPVIDDGNTVKITRAVPGGSPAVHGSQLVTKVIFKMLAGSGSITFAASSHVVDVSDSSDIFTSGTGTNYSVPAGCATTCVSVHRFYNFKDGAHFYTTSENEKATVDARPDIFRYEGISSFAQPSQVAGTTPVYRFYNFQKGVHFYTANFSEYQNVATNATATYRYEGIAYYTYTAAATNLVPVYRFYNFKNGVHFYTSNEAEKQNVIDTAAYTFRYEGIADYNIANP